MQISVTCRLFWKFELENPQQDCWLGTALEIFQNELFDNNYSLICWLVKREKVDRPDSQYGTMARLEIEIVFYNIFMPCKDKKHWRIIEDHFTLSLMLPLCKEKLKTGIVCSKFNSAELFHMLWQRHASISPSWYALVQSQQWKHQQNKRNRFKATNKDI